MGIKTIYLSTCLTTDELSKEEGTLRGWKKTIRVNKPVLAMIKHLADL